MSFAEYFSAISTESALSEELIPGLLKYYREPTMSRAKYLLIKLGAPIPYEELRLFVKTGRKSTNVSDSAFINAILRQQRSTKRSGRRHRKWKKPVADADFFAIYRCLDMVHDLSQMDAIGYLLDDLIAQVPDMPSEVSDQIWKILRIEERAARCDALVALAERVGAQVSGGPVVHMDLHPGKRVTSLRADIRFANQVSEWLRRPILEIVLDDVFTEPPFLSDKLVGKAQTLYALNSSEALRSLALCAFLQLVIGTWDPSLVLSGSDSPTAVREVRFLQALEVGGYDEFLQRWVRCLRKESAHFCALSAENVTYGSLSVTDAASAAAVSETGIHTHALFVPYRLPEQLRDSVPSRLVSARTAAMFLEKYRDYFYVSYNKRWLCEVHMAHYMLSKHYRNYKDVRQFMAALCEINAIRNSLRADAALSRGAVFITGNHMALVYYAKRAAQIGKPIAGLGINIQGLGDMNARFYPDPASARQLALL
jgi:hypothetical protein